MIDPARRPEGGAAPSGGWRHAVVRRVIHPSPRAVILRLEVPDRVDHLPGQHYVVRLTADDGYTASRSYSVASPPGDPLVELFVERLEDGEVSTYLADVVAPGDELEVRGPIGGWFVWDGRTPALGVGGGTGVVPLVAMLRHAVDVDRRDLLRFAVSARTIDDLPYATELVGAGAVVALTRVDKAGAPRSGAQEVGAQEVGAHEVGAHEVGAPQVGAPGSGGPEVGVPEVGVPEVGVPANGTARPVGRLTPADLAPLIAEGATAFVCGSARFAEAASTLLVDLGVPAAAVRVERFGPSGS